MIGEIISCKSAKQRNLKFYYTGKPCSKCKNLSKRYVSSGKCRFCHSRKLNKEYNDSFIDCEAKSTWRGKDSKTFNYNTIIYSGQATCYKHGLHNNWNKVRNVINNKYYLSCRECISERNKRYRKENFIKFMVKAAKSRGFECNITESDVQRKLEEQEFTCALSGIRFSDDLKPSLDRIDSSKGYIKNNIQLVLHEINTMKSNFDENRFIELCKAVYKNNKSL